MKHICIGFIACIIIVMVYTQFSHHISIMPLPVPAPTEKPIINSVSEPTTIPDDMSSDPYTLTIYDDLYADQRDAFAEESRAAYDYVAQRFGHAATQHFTVDIGKDYDCNLHGLTDATARSVKVLTCDSFSRAQTITILAHEFVHQLAFDFYGPDSPGADRILGEGISTWAADTYWLNGTPDFKTFVQGQINAGVWYDSTTDPTLVVDTDPLYYEWASFVDYLIITYGRDKFDAIFVSGSTHGMPGTANYQAVYGKNITTLTAEWQEWLNQ